MSSFHYLCKLRLAEPKEIAKFAKQLQNQYKGIKTYKGFFHYISEYRGHLILRTWAIRVRKNGDTEYSEVCRRSEDLLPVFCNIEWRGLAGWVVWQYGSKWDYKHSYDGWRKNIGWLYGKTLNREHILCKYDPHNTFEVFSVNTSLFEYIVKLQKEPAIEYLVKNGYGSLVNCVNMLDKKSKTIEGILKVDRRWVQFLKGKNRNYLIACRDSRVKTEEDAHAYVDLLSNSESKILLKLKSINYRQLWRYYNQHKYSMFLYKDYYNFAKELGYPLHQKECALPKDLRQAHNQAFEQIEINKSEKFNEGIQKQFKKLNKYTFQNETYVIRPCSSNAELILESTRLNHCVRTYAEKYSKGLTGIFFVRKLKNVDEPFVTVEFKNKHIVQSRAKNNDNPNNQVKLFLKKWEKEVVNGID